MAIFNDPLRKRLYMRSIRRGIKEMDIILTSYAGASLEGMDAEALAAYDAFLEENDHDLYQWVSGQIQPPARHLALVEAVRAFLAARG